MTVYQEYKTTILAFIGAPVRATAGLSGLSPTAIQPRADLLIASSTAFLTEAVVKTSNSIIGLFQGLGIRRDCIGFRVLSNGLLALYKGIIGI